MKYSTHPTQHTRSQRARDGQATEPLFQDLPMDTTSHDAFAGMLLNATWRLQSRIGAGGAGVVYQAEHCRSGHLAAVKFLRPRFKERPKYLSRFVQEIHILRQLKHPHIVDLLDYGDDHVIGTYVVIEYLRGIDLATAFVQQWEFAWREIVTLISQLCDAMAEAHRAGIVHRDLKPENIFLLDGDEIDIRVLDFGIAQDVAPEALRLTAEGVTVGTPAYISPEQAKGLTVDHRADIYALNAILYELLTGAPLFQSQNAYHTMKQHAFEPAPTLRQALPGRHLPPALEALVWEGLAKDPDLRPQSMSECKRRLRSALQTHKTLQEQQKQHPEMTPQPMLFGLTDAEPLFSPPHRDTNESETRLYRAMTPPIADDIVQGVPINTPSPSSSEEQWGDFSNEWFTQPPTYRPNYHSTESSRQRLPSAPVSYWAKRSPMRNTATTRSPGRRIGKILLWGFLCLGLMALLGYLMQHHNFI